MCVREAEKERERERGIMCKTNINKYNIRLCVEIEKVVIVRERKKEERKEREK